MKKVKIVLLLLILTIVVTACSMKGASDDSKSEYNTAEVEYDSAEDKMDDAKEEGQSAAGESASLANEILDTRKIIENARIDIETLDFESTKSQIMDLVDFYNGYTQNSNISGYGLNSKNQYNRRTGHFVFRIPADKYNAFLEGLNKSGHVLNENKYIDDVTSRYYDMEARVKTLKVQEERLIAILAKAEELEYILELERELADVRYQIENFTSDLRRLDNLIAYATVEINLYEVIEESVIEEPPTTLGEKISKGFRDSMEALEAFITFLIVGFITILPFLVFFGVLLIIVFIILKVLKKRKK